MKSKLYPWLLFSFFYTAITVNGQKPVYPRPNSSDQILFGKKLPPPALNDKNAGIINPYNQKMKGPPYTYFDTVLKQFKVNTPGQKYTKYPAPISFNKNSAVKPSVNPQSNPFCVHLTKDINSKIGSSEPTNIFDGYPYSFAVLNNISYFSANDGIHGRELWRSDGTPAGTYMVKDINTGEQESNVSGIIVVNGLLFFSAATAEYSLEPWISDGTESGTHMIKDIVSGYLPSFSNQFINANGTVFFTTLAQDTYTSQLWKTDGTEAGTVLVKDMQELNVGQGIFEFTAVNNMVFFVAYTPASGYQLFRSDGTGAGTFIVKEIGGFTDGLDAPWQLTAYNNKLYFSANDGTGRKLWVSDGTEAGTGLIAGINDVFIQGEVSGIGKNSPFVILNNVLYLGGFTTSGDKGLYKYDASNADGLILVQNHTPQFVLQENMRIVNDVMYYNITSNYHNELWSTKGETATTQLVKVFDPGDYIYNFYNSNGNFFFAKYDYAKGNELWKSDGTETGTVLVKDILLGTGASFPESLTFCNGKLLFRATDNAIGTELWASDGTGSGTTLVRDINSSTGSSYIGYIAASGNAVVFGAYTPELGSELYKSDGTSTGTYLLNDIAEGAAFSNPGYFIHRNGVNYFMGSNLLGTSIYKTNGTTGGLKKIIPDIDGYNFYIINYNVTDNGLAFYILYDVNTAANTLWRSDGTAAGTYVLRQNLSYNSYIAAAGNTVYFAAGDNEHGLELWKSNGTVAGTKMVKDIQPGFNGSDPYSLFVYKNHVYFGANDGLGLYNQLWKTDGTEKGTIKLKNITPVTYDNVNNPQAQVFCVSKNKLFFSATDYQIGRGQLWETNGTTAGTKLVKDINPSGPSKPYFLTDVNSVLYFISDVYGDELWTSKGTASSTKLVKDINPHGSSYLNNLCSAGGKLYFLNGSTYPGSIWSSDGTPNNTNQVTDPGLNGLYDIYQLTAAGNRLFFGANSLKYGRELYVGEACGSNFTAGKASIPEMLTAKPITNFDVLLYPNPAKGSASLRINGDAKDIAVTIADISGKVIWQKSFSYATQVSLPVEKLAAGIYIVTVKSGLDNKTLKLVKQ